MGFDDIVLVWGWRHGQPQRSFTLEPRTLYRARKGGSNPLNECMYVIVQVNTSERDMH